MRALLFLVALLALAPACGQEPAPEQSRPAPKEPGGVVGELSPTVEAGGWLLKSGEKEYLLLGIEEYRQAPWFEEGAKVRVAGEPAPGVVTMYMQGEPFRVESMSPAE